MIRVLVVEDSPADARLVREMLREAGAGRYDVEVAASLADALARIRAAPPDVLLLDLGLPDAQGLEALQAIRAEAESIPVIVLSGLRDDEVVGRAAEAGAQDYLVKGHFEAELLGRSIRYAVERKRSEQKIRLQTRALEATVDAVIITDVSGEIAWVNPAFSRRTGYSLQEVRGRNSRMFKSGLHDRAFYQDLWDTILSGRAWTGEMTNRKKDGALYTEETTITPVHSDRGTVTHFVAIKHDVSERRQRLAAEQASRLKSEFLANMSHELRTPLNAIIGFAELIHDGKVGPVPGDQKEFLADILTSSRHLLQLVNDLLDLAKVEAGRMDFRPERLDLARAVGEVRDILRTLAANKRIQVQLDVDSRLEVASDPAKLKQVLYNYLSNALKFTPEGGTVVVRARPEGCDEFRLEVEDTGPGIPAQDVPRLFLEFHQLDSSAAKRHQGTGLGLALTKRIVQAQGGRVGVQSTPGKGSVFFAVLPQRGLDGSVAATAATAPCQPGANADGR